MKFIQVIYNNNSEFIVEIVKKLYNNDLMEFFNIDYSKDKKKAAPFMVNHGTKNVPLIIFKDENLEDVDAIWSESNPNWEEEIIKKLNNE